MSDAQKYRVKEGATYAYGRVLSDRIGNTVVKVWDRPDYDGDILVESAGNGQDQFYVNPAFLEPVEDEFKVGDRVRAESKTNDDVAEFTVESVNTYNFQSEANIYTRREFNFTLLSRKPEPLKVGDEVLIDDERIPDLTVMVRSGFPMVKKSNGEVVWLTTNTSPAFSQNAPAKIVWLPGS